MSDRKPDPAGHRTKNSTDLMPAAHEPQDACCQAPRGKLQGLCEGAVSILRSGADACPRSDQPTIPRLSIRKTEGLFDSKCRNQLENRDAEEKPAARAMSIMGRSV